MAATIDDELYYCNPATGAEYAWERLQERSWEEVKEEDGKLVGIESSEAKLRRQR